MALITTQQHLLITADGFLVNPEDWNQEVALQLAQANNIGLTDAHWEILFFIRAYYQQYLHLPNTRMFVKAVASRLGKDKGNSRYLHSLFPEAPLKYACKLAGLPKPPNCI